MLSAENVSKRFRHLSGDIRVLDDISFETKPGEFITIFGPNGSGKTTLLNILADIESPEGGSIRISGKAPSQASIGFVFQNYHESLFPWKTVYENIVFPLEISGKKDDAAKKLIEHLLRRTGLTPVKHRYIYELSGGQKQLVSICRAIMIRPDLLLLDEPFSALDYSTTREMELELLDMWHEQPVTTLFVSHDIDEAIFLADRMLILSPRPATIKSILTIPLPRPRTLDLFTDARFIAIKRAALDLFAYEK